MIPEEKIQAYVNKVVEIFHPEKIILFGSYAYGTPNEDSDVDIFVLLNFEGKPWDMTADILDAANPDFPLDIICRTPEVLKQRLEWNDFFMMDIVEKGKVLYESGRK